jgi:3'-phosphoadenosine 5'-phosphosulfate sulfotransferase (PAPS reductase)/FAD synthetase
MPRIAGPSAHDFGADPIVVAYGMGVDSTAMLIGLRNRRVPIDLVMFADTGSEKPETTAYLPVIQKWLAAHNMAPVTVIKRHSPRAGDMSLHADYGA